MGLGSLGLGACKPCYKETTSSRETKSELCFQPLQKVQREGKAKGAAPPRKIFGFHLQLPQSQSSLGCRSVSCSRHPVHTSRWLIGQQRRAQPQRSPQAPPGHRGAAAPHPARQQPSTVPRLRAPAFPLVLLKTAGLQRLRGCLQAGKQERGSAGPIPTSTPTLCVLPTSPRAKALLD